MTYKLTFDGHEARVSPRLPGPVADGLSDVLSYTPTGSEFAPSHERNQWKGGKFNAKARWDGKIRLFKKNHAAATHNSFPSGLLSNALAYFKKLASFPVPTLTPNPVTPPAARTLHGTQVMLKGQPITIEIRDYQQDVVRELLAADLGRAMAESPTGSGKSIILAELCYKFPTLPILVTVPTLSLLHQTAADLSQLLGEKVGKVGDSECILERITVATIDSLRTGTNKLAKDSQATALKKSGLITWLNGVAVWMIDESHMSAADSYKDVSAHLINTQYRFGVSATIRREDGHELVFHGIIGPLVKRITPMELVNQGYLARPIIEMHVVEHTYEHEGSKKPPYSEIYQKQVVNNDERNNLILQMAYRCMDEKRTPCLILISDLEHGDILQEMLSHLGPTAYLKGEDDQKVRTQIVERFQAGEIPFLVASTIFDIGVDIPEIRAIILAGAGKSAARAIQRVGRGLRKKGNKTECLILDFEDREPYFLLEHSTQRKWWYEHYYPTCVTKWKHGKLLTELF